jgi:hypothetical protein
LDVARVDQATPAAIRERERERERESDPARMGLSAAVWTIIGLALLLWLSLGALVWWLVSLF